MSSKTIHHFHFETKMIRLLLLLPFKICIYLFDLLVFLLVNSTFIRFYKFYKYYFLNEKDQKFIYNLPPNNVNLNLNTIKDAACKQGLLKVISIKSQVHDSENYSFIITQASNSSLNQRNSYLNDILNNNENFIYKPKFFSIFNKPFLQLFYNDYFKKQRELIRFDTEYFEFHETNFVKISSKKECEQAVTRVNLGLNWAALENLKIKSDAPILIIIPDKLQGKSADETAENYKNLCHQAIEMGFRPCIYLNRYEASTANCIEENLLNGVYPSFFQIFNNHEDLKNLIDSLNFRLKNLPIYLSLPSKRIRIYLMGFGTGATTIINFLNRFNANSISIDGFTCVSAILNKKNFFNHSLFSNLLNYKSFYNSFVLYSLKMNFLSQYFLAEQILNKLSLKYFNMFNKEHLINDIDTFKEDLLVLKNELIREKSLDSFIRKVEVKSLSKAAKNSCQDFNLLQINYQNDLPGLYITSLDDPLYANEKLIENLVPFNNLASNSRLKIVVTSTGGYCSFHENLNNYETTWAENKCLNFIYNLDKLNKILQY